MKERIVIVFIATLLGLLLTTAGYFIYQAALSYQQENNNDAPLNLGTKNNTNEKKDVEGLTVNEPKNEAVLTNRTIEVKGRTFAENTVVVSTNSEDVVGTPEKDGDFSVSVTIDAGVNKIITRSIAPSGEEIIDERIVTYSSEEF